MFAWFSPRSGVEALTLTAAGLAAVGYLAHKVWGGVRAGLKFFRRIDKVIENVEKQLYPNGGSSLRDAVNRIQEHMGIENVTVDAHDPDQSAK